MWVDKINKKFIIALGLVIALFVLGIMGYNLLRNTNNNNLKEFSNSVFEISLPGGFSRLARSGSYLFAEEESENIPAESIEISYQQRNKSSDTVDKVLEAATTNFLEDASTPQPDPILTEVNGREAGKIVREGTDYENQSTTYYIFEADTIWKIKFRYKDNKSVTRSNIDKIINSFTPR